MKAIIERSHRPGWDEVRVMVPDGLSTTVSAWTPAQWHAIKAAIFEEEPPMATAQHLPSVYINDVRIAATTLLYKPADYDMGLRPQLFINDVEIWNTPTDPIGIALQSGGIDIRMHPLLARLVQLAWPWVEDAIGA